jgi:hypothetical protein
VDDVIGKELQVQSLTGGDTKPHTLFPFFPLCALAAPMIGVFY